MNKGLSRILGLLLLSLAACGGAESSAEIKLCRAVIEDIFLPQHNLIVQETAQSTEGDKLKVVVRYEITGADGKQTQDSALCYFDAAAGANAGIESIIQFGAPMPAQHVQFLNKRLMNKLGIAPPIQAPAQPTPNAPPS